MSGFSIASLLVWYVVFLFSTTFHEFAHSVLAYWGGDSTAYEGGQVSLDPVPHIKREPFGLVLFPLLSFFMSGGGWMIGWASAPFDPRWAQRNPGKYAAMSAAGPFGNFFLAIVAFFAMKGLIGAGILELAPTFELDGLVQAAGDGAQGGPWGMVAMALSILLCLNVLLGVFNLMPMPPLDGSGVLEGLFPKQLGDLFMKLRTSGAFQLLGLVIAWRVFPMIGHPVLGFVVNALRA